MFCGDVSQDIYDRRMVFCPNLAQCDPESVISTCELCLRHFVYCCGHNSKTYLDNPVTCHHFQIIYTDGSCVSNGRSEVRSGVGIVFRPGDAKDGSFSLPVDREMDGNAPRTSQRAELLAVIKALELARLNPEFFERELVQRLRDSRLRLNAAHRDDVEDTRVCIVIATDSKYVVDGMTDWLGKWKKNGYYTAEGRRPTNLDLFVKLDRDITDMEEDGFKIGFWWIPREMNLADGPAKRATQNHWV